MSCSVKHGGNKAAADGLAVKGEAYYAFLCVRLIIDMDNIGVASEFALYREFLKLVGHAGVYAKSVVFRHYSQNIAGNIIKCPFREIDEGYCENIENIAKKNRNGRNALRALRQ